jgi:hypothetical protein
MRLLSTVLAASLCTVLGAGELALGSAESQGRASVASVVAGRESDLVKVQGGYAAGLRPGMVCAVNRSTKAVAQVIIVEADAERAIALVLSLAPSAEILSGDQVEARANSRI